MWLRAAEESALSFAYKAHEGESLVGNVLLVSLTTRNSRRRALVGSLVEAELLSVDTERTSKSGR